jgi:hypothetical protein
MQKISKLNYNESDLAHNPCIQQQMQAGIVCACNSTYCDDFSPLGQLQTDQIAVYTSSLSGKRFTRTNLTFTNDTTG